MKKRYLLLIPVAVCVLVSAAALGYAQLHPERAPEQLQKLMFGKVQKTEEGSGSANRDIIEISLSEDEQRAAQLVEGMTTEQKLYQMMFVRPEALTGAKQVTRAGDATKANLEKMPVGGILYTADNLQSSQQTTEMISTTQGFAKEFGMHPLFIGIEEEGGLVTNAKALGTTSYDTMYSLHGDTEKAKQIGQTYASELGKLGFNVNLAPVADVLDSVENKIVGGQSFGTDAAVVSDMVANEVRGMQDGNMMAVLKHFPGYGSVASGNTDARDLDAFLASDLKPFAAGINQNAAFVLVSHMKATGLDSVPCSMSASVIEDILRGELGYNGIVMTDELDNGMLPDYTTGNAAVAAVQAGADVLLCPANITEAYDALVSAMEEGVITEERINESVQRILTAKITYGLIS